MVDALPDMFDLNVLWICVLLARTRPDTKVYMIPTHVLSGRSDRLARFKQLLTFCAVGSRDHATHALIEHGALPPTIKFQLYSDLLYLDPCT